MSQDAIEDDQDDSVEVVSQNIDPPEALDEILEHVLLRVFGRTPNQREIDLWLTKLRNKSFPAAAFLRQLTRTKSFLANKSVPVKNPAGHYFSPVVDPELVRDYYDMSSNLEPHEVGGIDFRIDDMIALWKKNKEFIAATPFSDQPDGKNRYYYRGGPYGYGDSITLRAMINNFRPRRMIEIGSGFSSACALDSAEHAGIEDFQLTCIEPYPKRLKSVLRPGDENKRVRIMERGVQGVPLDLFKELNANDILFIDSTHVMKTGSDVHYELFHILPVLNPGVIVHFHDCRYPFEYSEKQIFQKNYSWNEAYAVRALLMYSTRFRILFSGSLFAKLQPELVNETCPIYLRNPGSAIWVQVQE
jgi:predicted O-methyltransferase YrrM